MRYLGDELEVVCFLMATEIERLHDENYEFKQKVLYMAD